MSVLSSNDVFDLLKNNRDLLIKYQVRRIGLFGSHIRNQASSKSDIDLIVDFEKKTFDNYFELYFALEKIFNKKVDLLTEKGISPYILPYIQSEVRWYET